MNKMITKKIKKFAWNLVKPYVAFLIFFIVLFFVLLTGVQAFFNDFTTDNNYAFLDGIIWPLPGYSKISSDYGYRIHPIKHKVSFHDGIDIPAPVNTRVISPSNGIVTECSFSSTLGNTIKIECENLRFVFYHLNYIAVAEGMNITKGDEIGGVGSTGSLSTGSHLHFSVFENGELINPLSLVNFNQ